MPNKNPNHGLSFAWKISSELIAAVAVGTFLGLMLYKWLETKPIFSIIFIFLGFCSGMLNIYRIIRRIEKH